MQQEIQSIIKNEQRMAGDTGSPEVQISILTYKINRLSEKHFSIHKRDQHSKRGLLRMISLRKKLLNYLMRVCPHRCRALIKKLGLRPSIVKQLAQS